MRFIFNNLILAFNKMKFVKIKSFTFSNPNLDITKDTSKRILALFECSLHITEMMFKSKFNVSFYCPIGQ